MAKPNVKGKQKGKLTYIPDYLVSEGVESNGASGGTITGPILNNEDGAVEAIFAINDNQDKTGSSPTSQLVLKGGFQADGSDFVTLVDSSGNAINSGSATSISGAGSGTSVINSFQTNSKGVVNFTPFLRVDHVLGGTSTPGSQFRLGVSLTRRLLNAVGGV